MFQKSLMVLGAFCLLGASTADAAKQLQSSRRGLMRTAKKNAATHIAKNSNSIYPTSVNRLRHAKHLNAVTADSTRQWSAGSKTISPAMVFAANSKSLVVGDRVTEIHYQTKVRGTPKKRRVDSASDLNRMLNYLMKTGRPISIEVRNAQDQVRVVPVSSGNVNAPVSRGNANTAGGYNGSAYPGTPPSGANPGPPSRGSSYPSRY